MVVTTNLPLGFSSFVTNVGVKDSTKDFTVVMADGPCAASGVFTQSRFAGPSVVISRRHVENLSARAVVVISKNANVATGPEGIAHAEEVAASVAAKLGIDTSDVLIASTGVIGRQYPIDNIRAGISGLPFPLPDNDADDVARGIMTTDTVHKISSATVPGSEARIVGVAKGVGMIEPNMATLIAMIFTDADIAPKDLNTIFRGVINQTLNCVSVDTDTSTSDTAIILASGKAGPVDSDAFTQALHSVLLDLTKAIARDGEGAETLIEVVVDAARNAEQAKTVAKSIVNSPLVKTAVHGADPNWGRVAMAVGKCSQYTDIDQEKVVIRFGTQEVYPTQVTEAGLEKLSQYMRGADVTIHVSLATGTSSATVWGCDLTDGYVRINADYTT
ncbi:MAG: bifunctional glutamate N-acetyltransferase/amino-acid acetyltransferase ArgJ [Actinobacteria bacterium]|nr:bifunctional glutamate N-acetyltransferase/amino-acid acetyltransferase ArgJ [Actinomycetota bacterium]